MVCRLTSSKFTEQKLNCKSKILFCCLNVAVGWFQYNHLTWHLLVWMHLLTAVVSHQSCLFIFCFVPFCLFIFITYYTPHLRDIIGLNVYVVDSLCSYMGAVGCQSFNYSFHTSISKKYKVIIILVGYYCHCRSNLVMDDPVMLMATPMRGRPATWRIKTSSTFSKVLLIL